MIRLTRLNGKEFVLNAELIELVEATPDVVITLVNRNKFLVQEALGEVVTKVIEYKRSIHRAGLFPVSRPGEAGEP